MLKINNKLKLLFKKSLKLKKLVSFCTAVELYESLTGPGYRSCLLSLMAKLAQYSLLKPRNEFVSLHLVSLAVCLNV